MIEIYPILEYLLANKKVTDIRHIGLFNKVLDGDTKLETFAKKIFFLYYFDAYMETISNKYWQDIPNLITPLRPHQKRDILLIEKYQGKALIGEDMGSGKTLTALSYLIKANSFPALIITPATLKYNWAYEIKKHFNKEIPTVVIDGEKWADGLQGKDVSNHIFIINYDIVNKWKTVLRNIPFNLAIIDEIHKIKSYKSQRTTAVRDICLPIKKVLALTGTPIPNRPIELFTTLNIVRPDKYSNVFHFGNKYHHSDCPPELWNTNKCRPRRLDELYVELKENILIRSEIDLGLPQLNKIFIPFEVYKNDNYNKTYDSFMELKSNRKKKNIEEDAKRLFNTMREVSCLARKSDCYKWIKDKIEDCGKAVVFVWYKETLKDIAKLVKPEEVVTISGEISAEKRQKAVESFQSDPSIKLCVLTLGAGAEGLTLTSASTLIFMEYAMTPSMMDQALKRIHRIGQKNVCNIYYLYSQDTIEENIMRMLDKKKYNITKAIDGVLPTDIELWYENIIK